MKLLVIETGFAALSVALIDGGDVVAEHHEIVGRGHAEKLMPSIVGLLAGRAPPSAILVDAGPGSYTGLRVGIAAARALGLAWQVGVTATTSTALLAAGTFGRHPTLTAVTAVLDAGRGQVYAETIAADWSGDAAPCVLAPVDLAASLPCDAVLTGSGALLVRIFGEFAVTAGDYPRAADARWLSASRRRADPTPLYLDPIAAAAPRPKLPVPTPA